MPRRPPEFRRPARSLLSGWTCWLLGFFTIVGLVLFVMHHRHQNPFERPTQEMNSRSEDVPHESSNFTQELLSSISFARRLVDQVNLAKAFVVIAKENGNFELAWKFSSEIRNCQRLLSQAAVRGRIITREEAHPTINRLSELIYKAQDLHYDISTTITTLKNHLEALEERSAAAIAQSAALGQLASEAVPKNLHCLNTKLTVDWFEDPALKKLAEERRKSSRLVDNQLYHFCVFSDNVLAASVVVNSTVSNADHPQLLVFHVVTNGVSFRAMDAWFLRHEFKGCTVVVRNVQELSWLNASYSPLVKQLRHRNGGLVFVPKLGSLMNHLRFYIPELHPSLEKVVLLEDDVVVQKDLTPLFSMDLHGNVIGAVETCLDGFHRFYNYLNFSNPLISSKFDPQACGWALGVNVVDLIAWKSANVTAKYHYWQEQNAGRTLWKTGTLSPALLAFYGMMEPLDRRWHVLGLGYDSEIDDRLISTTAVLHFNGHLKPWLKLAIGRYKHLWEQYVNSTHPDIQHCMH